MKQTQKSVLFSAFKNLFENKRNLETIKKKNGFKR